MEPTDDQIKEQIKLLKDNQKKVVRYNSHGEDNHVAIDAQIETLEHGLSRAECEEKNLTGEWDEYVYLAADLVAAWLEGETNKTPIQWWIKTQSQNGSDRVTSTVPGAVEKLPSSPSPSTGLVSSSGKKGRVPTIRVTDTKTSPRQLLRQKAGSKKTFRKSRKTISRRG